MQKNLRNLCSNSRGKASLPLLLCFLFLGVIYGCGKSKIKTKVFPASEQETPDIITLNISSASYNNGQIRVEWSGDLNKFASFHLAIATDLECKNPLITKEALDGSSYSQSIEEAGDYYVCLSGKDKKGEIHAAKNNGLKVVVPSAEIPETEIATQFKIIAPLNAAIGESVEISVMAANKQGQRVQSYQNDVTLNCLVQRA